MQKFDAGVEKKIFTVRMFSKIINKGKTEYSNKTPGSCSASARPLPNKYFSASVSQSAFDALLK